MPTIFFEFFIILFVWFHENQELYQFNKAPSFKSRQGRYLTHIIRS